MGMLFLLPLPLPLPLPPLCLYLPNFKFLSLFHVATDFTHKKMQLKTNRVQQIKRQGVVEKRH